MNTLEDNLGLMGIHETLTSPHLLSLVTLTLYNNVILSKKLKECEKECSSPCLCGCWMPTTIEYWVYRL